MEKKTVVVGMSGGVDSSVAAYLLKEQGYNVIGVTMQIWKEEESGCCGLSAIEDARRVAFDLGIPHYVMNFRSEFQEKVVDYFIDEYLHGRTPNPCIACNRYVKWESLLKRSRDIGADYIATGHYARIDQLENGRYSLKRSATLQKDQTYALYNLTQEQLATNSGLETEYIADVEEGRVYPPVGSIIKLSRALGQRVGTFMDDQFQPDPIIVRKDERVEETSNKAADGQYHYFPLGRGKTDRHMEPMFIRIMPDVAHTTSSHEGEEFIIVVSGKILVKYGKEETYFNAVIPHYIGAVDGPAEIYAVLYTPF